MGAFSLALRFNEISTWRSTPCWFAKPLPGFIKSITTYHNNNILSQIMMAMISGKLLAKASVFLLGMMAIFAVLKEEISAVSLMLHLRVFMFMRALFANPHCVVTPPIIDRIYSRLSITLFEAKPSVIVSSPSTLVEVTANTNALHLTFPRKSNFIKRSSLATHQETSEWFLCRWKRLPDGVSFRPSISYL